jgi:hypothetical protein
MPFDAWLLLVVSVGLGLGLEIIFMRARRRDRVPPATRAVPASVPNHTPDDASSPESDE